MSRPILGSCRLDTASTPKSSPPDVPVVLPSAPAPAEIPVAVRETPTEVTPARPAHPNRLLYGGLTTVGVLALLAGGAVSWQLRQSQTTTLATANPLPTSTMDIQGTLTVSPATNDTLLGHIPYKEAPKSELTPITPDGSMLMRKPAAAAFQSMVAAASQAGVRLVPLSAFRSKTDQDYLFFDVKAERGQVATERAKVSAPPGYSEHHTGYAVDIGDGDVAATNLSQAFEQTAAYRWLKENAAHYSFEISFPKNNRQGVSYEPWHWRFVGDRQSLETFYRAHSLKQPQAAASPSP